MKLFKTITCCLAVAMSAVFVSCGDDDGSGPTPPPVTGPSRTVIAYMVATNSLNGADDDDILQMRQAVTAGALGDNGHLLIYRAAIGTAPKLAVMDADGTTRVLREYGAAGGPDGVNSLDPDFMRSVIADAMAMSPSDEYGLILWSHSTGWRGIDTAVKSVTGRSFGDDYGRMLTIPQLADVFTGLPRLLFIYFDSCFMGNVETLYELRHATDWVIASPAETPFDGAPYHLSLASLYAPVPDGLDGCARAAFDYYMSQSSAVHRSSTMAVYRMSGLDALADAVAGSLSATSPLLSVDALQQYGFPRAYAYFPDTFFDLGDYMTARGGDVADALDGVVYSYYATPYMWGQYPLDRVCGLSVFPYDELKTAGDRYSYTGLEWYDRVYRDRYNVK